MRKIFLAAVFIFALLIENISSAADYKSIDWQNVPHFNNKADFINYIKNCEKNCVSFVPVVFSAGVFVDVNEFLKISKHSQYANLTWWNDKSGRPREVLYEMTFYPGTKVAYAYLTGNTSILNGEERQLYKIAVEIVNEANRRPTTLLKEHYIHEKITELVTYHNVKSNDKTPRHCNAIGALIDGRANCQGYTDSFYMLCRMLNFDVGKMSGVANKQPHVWNTINFGDGRIYGVDVTWDDASFTFADSGEYTNYIYFNAPLEIMQTTHSWERAYNAQLYPELDGRYFYYTQEFQETGGRYFAFHSSTAENALGYIAQRIARDGWKLSWGMAPYDSRYADIKFSLNRLVKEILPKRYRWTGHVKMNVARRGNWLFYTVDATKH